MYASILARTMGIFTQFVSHTTNELRIIKIFQVLNLNKPCHEWGWSNGFVTEAQTGKIWAFFLTTIFAPCLVENLFSVKFLFLLACHFLWIINTWPWIHILGSSHWWCVIGDWWCFECQSECQGFQKPWKNTSLLSNVNMNSSFAVCHHFHL